MARFKLFVEYAGTKYSGWQIQKNARTVQGELTRVIAEVTAQKQFELYGSGRTDAGVHALEQVAHLDIITAIPAETLRTQPRRRATWKNACRVRNTGMSQSPSRRRRWPRCE